MPIPTGSQSAGDSAGGNLAAVAALSARDVGLPLRAQILVYPAVDLRRDSDRYASVVENAEVPPLTRATMDWFVGRYVADAAVAGDWRVSPILAPDKSGLAPALVIVAEHDVLRDEGLAYADALVEAGVAVERIAVPGLIHGFFTMGGVLDAAGAALDAVATRAEAAVRASELYLSRSPSAGIDPRPSPSSRAPRPSGRSCRSRRGR